MKPVIENIVDDVIATLATVKRPAFNQDLEPVRPSPAQGNRVQDGSAIVYLGQRVTIDERPQQYAEYHQLVTVRIYVLESESSDVPIDRRLNNAACDVEKALCSSETIRRRGGWAIDTWPDSITPLPSALGANEGAIDVDLIVHYRHAFGDPYTSPHRS